MQVTGNILSFVFTNLEGMGLVEVGGRGNGDKVVAVGGRENESRDV